MNEIFIFSILISLSLSYHSIPLQVHSVENNTKELGVLTRYT